MIKIVILCVFFIFVTGKVSFDNYSVYKVSPKTIKHIEILRALEKENDKLDFWNDPNSILNDVSIMSSPNDKEYLEGYLKSQGLSYNIAETNVQALLANETVKKYISTNTSSMSWDAYYTLADINAWIDDLARTYPSVASVIIGGSSHEGRQIKGLKISHGPGRKIIFIESGIHAREWITQATTNFIIHQLLTSDNKETRAAAREFDWYIFPVTNPDGYVWTHTSFRMWRKNRRPVGSEFGVDLNRNWNNNWLVAGSSSTPSSSQYAGPGPFSEPETRTLSKYITSLADDIVLYLSMHSSGQLLLIPFGNTTEHLANYDDAVKIGRRAMGALSVRYGTPYTTGNVAEAIYPATGGSIDWVKEHLKIPLVYCFELRDRGTYGHLLPPNQIRPSGEETMDSILEMIHQAKRLGYMNTANMLQEPVIIIVFMFFNLYFV